MVLKKIIWAGVIILALVSILSAAVFLWTKKNHPTIIQPLKKGSILAEQAYQQALQAKNSGAASQAKALIVPAVLGDGINPAYLEVYGWAEFNLNNFDQAADIYQKLSAGDPQASYFNYLGNARREAGKGQEAVRAFEQAIEADMNFKTAYQNLVNYYASQNWLNKKNLVAFLQKQAANTNNKLAEAYLEEVLKR